MPIAGQQRSFYPSPSLAESEEPALRRLAFLHEECVETARHAEQLARTPLAACALIFGCAIVVALSAQSVPLGTLGLWALLVLAGAFGMLRLVQQTERAAFELMPLRAFALDLNAMLLYAGFAWGAGAFLAVPPDASALTLEWYAVGASLAVTGLFRAPVPTLCFVVPSTSLAVAAALVGAAGTPAAAMIMLLALVLAGSSSWAERRKARLTRPPAQPALTHS
jgi:hypothetical protein